MIARNARIAAIRKSFGTSDLSRQLPIPNAETRSCVAMDANGNTIGIFDVVADDCLSQDTILWEGHYWNLQLMAECGRGAFPSATWFAFDDSRPLSRIR